MKFSLKCYGSAFNRENL